MNLFHKPESAPAPELTCEQMRQQRREESREQLHAVNKEIECLADKMRAFKLVHTILLGGRLHFRCSDIRHAKDIREQFETYLRDLAALEQARDKILQEFSALTVNEAESRHVAGVTVHAD